MAERTVVVDANVLINLAHLDRLDLLGALDGFNFVIPQEVRQEVKSAEARGRLDRSLSLDEAKTVLERCRFKMAFGSFREIL